MADLADRGGEEAGVHSPVDTVYCGECRYCGAEVLSGAVGAADASERWVVGSVSFSLFQDSSRLRPCLPVTQGLSRWHTWLFPTSARLETAGGTSACWIFCERSFPLPRTAGTPTAYVVAPVPVSINVALSLGPVVGGALTYQLGWR